MATAVSEPTAAAVPEPASSPARRRFRLHEEILAPELEPATPADRRRVRRTILVLLLIAVVIQPLSVPVSRYLNAIERSDTDAYSVWQHYLSTPVPDVLILGASDARTTVDEAQLTSDLSQAAGRRLTVEKLGFAGEGPAFFDLFVYRVMKMAQRPRTIVLTLQAPAYTGNCAVCQSAVTPSVAAISGPDPGFVQLALQKDPEPVRLVGAWLVPVSSNASSLLALSCLGAEAGRAVEQALLHKVSGPLKDLTRCEGTAAYQWARQPEMTSLELTAGQRLYKELMDRYSVSATGRDDLADMVSRAQAGGTKVVFLLTPVHSAIREISPRAEAEFMDAVVGRVAREKGVPTVDLRAAVPDDPTLWVDPEHLDQRGARYLSPSLAGGLAPLLPQS